MSAGAVIACKDEIAATNGENIKVIKNKIATTSDVRPDLPPAATPEEDSIYAVAGVVPSVEPTVVATASAVKAAFALGIFHLSLDQLVLQHRSSYLLYQKLSRINMR